MIAPPRRSRLAHCPSRSRGRLSRRRRWPMTRRAARAGRRVGARSGLRRPGLEFLKAQGVFKGDDDKLRAYLVNGSELSPMGEVLYKYLKNNPNPARRSRRCSRASTRCARPARHGQEARGDAGRDGELRRQIKALDEAMKGDAPARTRLKRALCASRCSPARPSSITASRSSPRSRLRFLGVLGQGRLGLPPQQAARRRGEGRADQV